MIKSVTTDGIMTFGDVMSGLASDVTFDTAKEYLLQCIQTSGSSYMHSHYVAPTEIQCYDVIVNATALLVDEYQIKDTGKAYEHRVNGNGWVQNEFTSNVPSAGRIYNLIELGTA